MPQSAPDKVKAKKIGRKRKVLGWTLLTLGLLMAVVWLASGRWAAFYRTPGWSLGLAEGFVYVYTDDGPLPLSPQQSAGLSTPRFPAYRWPWQYEWWPIVDTDRTITYTVALPSGVNTQSRSLKLWAPCATLLAASALLLWSEAAARGRAIKGMCAACGYSLAGLDLDAACPECGRKRAAQKPI